MAGDLTEQTGRAEHWLKSAKWKLRQYNDFRPRSDIQQIERFVVDVPRELLRGMVEHLVAAATVSDPQIEGGKFGTGPWTFTRIRWEREQEKDDNFLTLVQTMVAGTGAGVGAGGVEALPHW